MGRQYRDDEKAHLNDTEIEDLIYEEYMKDPLELNIPRRDYDPLWFLRSQDTN